MLEQTKTAVRALKQAGFERSEFSCQVERHAFMVKEIDRFEGDTIVFRKRQYTEYGDVIIYVKAGLERQLSLIDNMLDAGLDVTLYQHSDGSYGYPSVKLTRLDGRGTKKEVQF